MQMIVFLAITKAGLTFSIFDLVLKQINQERIGDTIWLLPATDTTEEF